MEDYLFFFPLHCIQGKKGAEWSFSLNADPGANDQHEMVVEVFFFCIMVFPLDWVVLLVFSLHSFNNAHRFAFF
jgi:hypothetical protein